MQLYAWWLEQILQLEDTFERNSPSFVSFPECSKNITYSIGQYDSVCTMGGWFWLMFCTSNCIKRLNAASENQRVEMVAFQQNVKFALIKDFCGPVFKIVFVSLLHFLVLLKTWTKAHDGIHIIFKAAGDLSGLCSTMCSVTPILTLAPRKGKCNSTVLGMNWS